jgi:hypothetical protein
MSFSSWPVKFGNDLAESTRSIRLRLLGKSLPPVLYHYTGFKGVLGIGDSCVLHAISTEDSKDQTEIQHGIEIVREEIQRKEESEIDRFAQMLLSSLPEALSSRKRWTFAACFCPELGSSHHRTVYGEYCLRFDTCSSLDPQLRPRGLHADVQYQHVIYAPSEKQAAIRQAINSIADAAVRNSSGTDPQGPWAQSVVKLHARVAAQGVMGIMASLKSPTFCKDNEWRIVCCPRSSIASSAPDLDDNGFSPLIDTRQDNKKCVELSVREQGETFVSFPKSVIPFSAIYVPDDFQRRDSERLAIVQMLEANGRSDIPLLKFPRTTETEANGRSGDTTRKSRSHQETR